MLNQKRRLRLGMVAGLTLMLGVVPGSQFIARAQGDSGRDAQIEADVHKTLDNQQYAKVNVAVHDANVTLTGTVDLYAEKEDADRRVHHVKHVKAVDNELQVGGAAVDDAALRNKLAKGLAYDRVGYGTTPFNALTVGSRMAW